MMSTLGLKSEDQCDCLQHLATAQEEEACFLLPVVLTMCAPDLVGLTELVEN